MTCKQLGGVCAMEFYGATFEEIAAQSKKHGREMFLEGDVAHLEAMEQMRSMNPVAMKHWFDEKRNLFNAL